MWEVKKIKDIALVTAGQSPEGKYYNENAVGLPFYQGKKEFTERYIGEPKVWTSFVTKEAIEGDVLMSVRAPVGPVNFATQKCCIGRGLASIRVKEKFDKDFLFLFFKNIENKLTGNTGAVFNSINKAQIENIEIPIPTLEEQRTIVAKLDQAFAAIDQAKANIEKNIANAKELFQSKLNQIFSEKGEGWEEKRIKEIGKVQTGTTPPTKDKDNYGEFIPFIKPAHFNSDGSLTPLDSYLSEKGIKKSRLIEANSVLMVCIGATIGKTGFTEIDITCNQQINAVTPSKNYNYKFIYFGMISRIFQDEVLENGKGAQATLPIINKSKWENLFLNVNLNKDVQQQIVTQLDQLQEQTNLLVTKYQQKLANLEELKKSILEKAFKGELV